MRILVAYATRHGATAGIAKRIAEMLERAGHSVTLQRAADVSRVDDHDAYVIGSAAYMGSWLKEASDFVRRNRQLLAQQPVWLFSSGPIGTQLVDDKGRDVIEASRPAEFAEFESAIHPRDEHVFFGAYDPDAPAVGLLEKVGSWFTRMPSIRKEIPAGDFRDWPAIEAWADGIASDLTAAPVLSPA